MAGAQSAQVPVDICNAALGKVGGKFITSITGGDPSNEALQCSNCYYDKVDELLEANDWSFARNIVNLAQLSVTLPYNPGNGSLNIVYAKPQDFIKTRYKSSRWAQLKVSGVYLLSDTANLGIWYTYRNLVVNTYSPKFKVALAALVASEIAFALTNSAKKADLLLKEYEEIKLPEAISSDSQQGDAPHAIQDEWDLARMAGSVALAGVPGQNVWYPVN